jgi:hypothetical protein
LLKRSNSWTLWFFFIFPHQFWPAMIERKNWVEEEEGGGKHRNEAFYVLFHMSSVCAFLLWNAYMCSICRVFRILNGKSCFMPKVRLWFFLWNSVQFLVDNICS